MSSLRRGHANLLCMVPILSDVPEGTTYYVYLKYKEVIFFQERENHKDDKKKRERENYKDTNVFYNRKIKLEK